MADRSLINQWQLDAEDQVGSNVAAQIEWLKLKRREYSEAMRGGDWETQQTSNDGASSSMRRGISDREHHDAIVEVLRKLGATEVGERPGIVIPVFHSDLR